MKSTTKSKIGNWAKNSISARMLTVGFLILVLLIPLSYIKSLILERSYRQEIVVKEINNKWGTEVLLYGPILKVPYNYYTEETITIDKEKQIKKHKHTQYYYFFPKELTVDSTIKNKEKRRGIYEASVYKGTNKITGSFGELKFDASISENDICWNEASFIFKTTNLKGITNEISIQIANKDNVFISKYSDENMASGNVKLHTLETKKIQLDPKLQQDTTPFSMQLNISGIEQFRIIPIGKKTLLNIKSNWKTANFIGEFLPYNSDKITKDGFDAKWKVLHINRPFPQVFHKNIPNLNKYAMGVNFKIPVNQYQQNERTAKYGYLVIALTFLVFFLIQTISKIKIHPFQYIMIGLALVLFYTLLISISEHSNFFKAYLISSSSTILLISLYSKSILKNTKFPLFIALSLTALYGFIFTIIQLENYALLTGSIGLFLILAMVMYVSRKIDWE